MDLQAEYNRIEKQLRSTERSLDQLESSGQHGTDRYEELTRRELELMLELEALEQEIDR